MATPFPTRSASGSARLFPYSVAATFVTIGLPFAGVVLVDHVQGFEGMPPLIWAVVAITGAILASAIGTALWMQHPASNEVSFGDLMIWSWARSAQARRQLVRSFTRLTDEAEVMSPHDRLATLREMSGSLDRKDPYTYGHSRRVERLAYRTGLALDLHVRELEDLREAAFIHDVGKIYIPDEILQKEGPLTDEEFGVIKGHSAVGARMVSTLGRPELTEAVRYHHERWDGRGYPDGVQANSIPLLARIVGTVDAYDAMTSMRSYRASLGHKRAVEILKQEQGKQFDEVVVTAFLSTLRNPLLAVISVPLLAGPIEALRRFFGWMGRSARADLATAAGAVGMAVAVTGSVIAVTGDPPHRSEEVAVSELRVFERQVFALSAFDANGTVAPGPDDPQRKDDRPGGGNKKDRPRREKDRAPKERGGTGPEPSGGRGSASTGNAGDPAAASEPQAPEDPNPGKGKDCKNGGSASVGKKLHCG